MTWAGGVGVLSSAKIGCGSWRYYTQGVACQATDYYLGHGEAPGRWHGRGLAAVGLEPGLAVSEQQLEALFARALHPSTGQRLGSVWRKDGVTGFDLTFSAPKTCSALWALGSGEVAAAVKASHQAAVQAGLAYLDTYASRSRRGTNGVEQITSDGLAVALFDHRTSREGDPQLHTHALVVNKVRCTDGTWRTLDAKDLFGHKKSAGMIYQAALRNELHQRLDVQFGEVNEHGQAEILGMPTDLCKLWSKRTTAIDAEAAPKIIEYEKLLGRTLSRAERAAVVKTAVLKTRPGKTHPEPQSLQQGWTAEAARAGWTPEQVLRAVGPLNAVVPAQSAGSNEHDEAARVLAALQAAGQRQAVFSRADVAGQVAAHLPTSGLTASEVVAKVEAFTDQALALVEAVPVGSPVRGGTPRASDARYATVQVLSAEARILALARQGRLGGYGRVPDERVKLAAAQAGRLDPDQQYALGR
ncbi:MAG: relaxase domain-containing protein, partial [Actinomycetota bacterium]|nr:relaxase domain-containing protein [Actinomycetota bacterium]